MGFGRWADGRPQQQTDSNPSVYSPYTTGLPKELLGYYNTLLLSNAAISLGNAFISLEI